MRSIVIALVAACGSSAKPVGSHATSGPAMIEWRAAQGANDHVNVSIVVDGTATPLGALEAFSDEAAGTPATCKLRDNPTPTAIEFGCGGGPMYNYYRAELTTGELVVTKVTGADEGNGHEHDDEKRTEVKRLPVAAASLNAVPFTPPAK